MSENGCRPAGAAERRNDHAAHPERSDRGAFHPALCRRHGAQRTVRRLRRGEMALCAGFLHGVPISSRHARGKAARVHRHQSLDRRAGSARPYASVGGARGEKQRLRQLPHVQRLRPARDAPERHGARVQRGAPPRKHGGVRLHPLALRAARRVGGVGEHHRAARVSQGLPCRHDRHRRAARRARSRDTRTTRSTSRRPARWTRSTSAPTVPNAFRRKRKKMSVLSENGHFSMYRAAVTFSLR